MHSQIIEMIFNKKFKFVSRMPSGAAAAAAPAAGAQPAENGGVPRTELQELQMKAGQVTDDVS